MNRKSQKDRILAYLKSGKRITTWIAFTKFKCTRLSERIREIDRDISHAVAKMDPLPKRYPGIKKEWVKTDKTRVMSYRL